MEPVTTAIFVFKLATWGLRAVNEVVKLNNLTQKKSSGTKSSSGAITKLDRELKETELKYYKDKTKRERDLLAIEKQRLANDNIRIEIEEARLGIDTDRLKLSKQERKDRLEISRLHRELLKEIQVEESKVKLQGKQIDWDNTRDNWFSKISREETQSILTKYNHRLLILTSPPEIDPYFDNAKDFQQWSFKQEMRKIDKFLSQYYPNQSTESPVQFYYDYFKETISKIDVNRLHDLLSSVATYVLYSDISDDTVTFWVAHWQTEQSEASHFPPFEWNWRETRDKLVAQGQTEAAAILVVKQTIIEIHRLLTAYLADSYYLTIDPFYEPQLFEIFKEQEQAALQPFVESLREFQVAQRTAYYQELARIEEAQKTQPFSVDLRSGVKLDMLYIPGGNFRMGSTENASEQPQHQVNIQSFHMGKYPITQAQYQAVMGNNPASLKGDNRPVENVSLDDAIAFCQKLSQLTGAQYSLPSESQWEYACRAGTTTSFSFGDHLTANQANFGGTGKTTDVGTFPANGFGLHDMHGNVWEWCLDTWHENYNGAPTDGSAWIENDNRSHLLRGGSWGNAPVNCRGSNRNGNARDSRNCHYGFRVVCPLSPGFP
jgi:formylglycine-generating enzyme required for sulfatase activity